MKSIKTKSIKKEEKKTKTTKKVNIDSDSKDSLVNPRWNAFCHFYLFGGEFPTTVIQKVKGKSKKKKRVERFRMGNGTISYCLAYGLDYLDRTTYNTASVSSHDLLRNPKIKTMMREILDDEGFNDEVVDARHMDIIINGRNQDSNTAIKEYNNLRKRIDNTPQNNIVLLDPSKKQSLSKAIESLRK